MARPNQVSTDRDRKMIYTFISLLLILLAVISFNYFM